METFDAIPAITLDGPSGLQETPITSRDALARDLDLSSYVTCSKDGSQQLELIVQGARCAGCLNKIEQGLSSLPGVEHVRMNLSSLRLLIRWKHTDLNARAIVSKLGELGFGAVPYDISEMQSRSETELRGLLRAIAVAGFAAMNVMLLSISVWSGGEDMNPATHNLFHWVSAFIALPTVAYSGRSFFVSAWAALKARQTNMDVPISLALILACSLSVYETVMANPDTYFDAAVMLLFLLLIGRYLDARLRSKAGEAAQQLAALQVTSATRILESGGIETVAARLICPGDRLLIPAGQVIPVDCIIEAGQSDIDMQIATGETAAQAFGIGDTLYSGTLNITNPLTVKAIAASTDSFLADITEMVALGEQKKSRFVKIADRAAQAYVPIVHSIALMTFIGWMVMTGDMRTATINAVAVLIITCPCALGLAVPAVQIVTTGRLFKQGVLLRSGDALERLAKVKSVIFDKTGTLTTGQFTLRNAQSLDSEHIQKAAALAQHSNHPLARALHQYPVQHEVLDVIETSGFGLTGSLKGRIIKFGSAAHVGLGDNISNETAVWFQEEDAQPVQFLFKDQYRQDAGETIQDLVAMSLDVEMLSGDRPAIVESVARDFGLNQWRGGVSPKEKLTHINQLQTKGLAPLMVGDGINDAPALASATASASLATASGISRSTADVVLQGDKLEGLSLTLRLARKSQKRVIENLSLAVGYNLLAIPLAVAGLVNPLIAALAMSGSSLLVTLNALRMAKA